MSTTTPYHYKAQLGCNLTTEAFVSFSSGAVVAVQPTIFLFFSLSTSPSKLLFRFVLFAGATVVLAMIAIKKMYLEIVPLLFCVVVGSISE